MIVNRWFSDDYERQNEVMADMKLHYRYGWPLGHILAKAGVPTKIRVDVIRDDEAGVFVGTSTDVRGLVIEAASLEELVAEAKDLIPAMVSMNHATSRSDVVDVRFRERLCHA